ncbi:MAG: iron transporter [Planctomycetes bacterium]|nr:iron transporter [Planctomycetota bacterium]
MRILKYFRFSGLLASSFFVWAEAPFREFPIGEPVTQHAMKIAAVWLPPIQMEGMAEALDQDIVHLECDIHAVRGNKNGFGVGEWIPYLTVKYRLEHGPSGKKIEGTMMPMVAKDGPHYGATVKLASRGEYTLSYEIRPPTENGLGRHSDPVTGVEPFWKPFTVQFAFDYQGVPP